MPTVADFIKELDRVAPPQLADDGDPIGLHVGDPGAEVSAICFAVDPSNAVVNAAIERGAGLVVTHHPLIYRPLAALVAGDPVAERVMRLARAGVALFVMHTNFDTVQGGTNDVLAEMLGVVDTCPLTNRRQDKLHKIAVFVPQEALEGVRDAMAEAGAGRIGEYTHCSFRAQGVGSFAPMPTAKPYSGSAGQLEEVSEYRLEMLCAGSCIDRVIAAMVDKHPYEEVAYDVYELANTPVVHGYGRVGRLERETTLGELAELVTSELSVRYPRVCGDPGRVVSRVALCSGGGASLFREAAASGADVYITGDTTHHNTADALDLGLALIDAGHFETEKPGMVSLAERLKRTFADIPMTIDYVE